METPVAAAAPAAAPSPAPVSAPAPAPAATPAAPTPSSPEQTSTPVAVPAAAETSSTTPAVEAPAAATASPKPNRAEYGDNIDKFLRDTYAWEEANPDGTELTTGDEVAAEPEVADAAAAEATAEAEAQPGEEATPADTAAVEAPTPEGLSRLIEATPEFKGFLEEHPEVKGQIFAMARQNAKAAPILEVFPNVEAAKFAHQSANEFVGLKTAFQLSDSPEKMADAAQMFLEQFKVVDDKGAPVLDAGGNPTYGEDLTLFVDHIKGRDRTTRIEDLKARIESGKYTTAQGKENDEQLLAAYEFIAAAESADPTELDKPDTSQMTPEMKAYFEKRDKEIADEKERLGLKDKEFSKKQQSENRERYRTQYREKFGASTGRYLANYLQQKEAAGTVIPRYLLAMKDPKTGVPVIAQQAFEQLNAKIKSFPGHKSHSATLEMNAINEQGLEARVTWGQERIDEFLPDIIDGILKEAGVAMQADAQQKIADREARRGDARVEPAAGGPVSPRAMTEAQLMAKAKENVATKLNGTYLDPGKRLEMVLQEKYRLEAQR